MKRTMMCGALVLSILLSCVPRVAWYSPEAYTNTVDLKVETRNLVLTGFEPYDKHADEIGKLSVRMEKAYEYAKGIPDNEITTKQWEIMKDPARNLAGGFFKMWKEKGALGETFVAEKAKQIDLAYDQIIGLESHKIKKPNSE
jgi:hypothetical protein